MNTDVIESVLHEVLNEQKETLKLNKQLVSKIECLSGKLENFEKDIKTCQNVSCIGDTKSVETITEGMENIKRIAAANQKNAIHEKRILIFPKFKSPECYRLFFNCITYITIATYSFLIIKIIVYHWCR